MLFGNSLLKVGDRAPEFELGTAAGKAVRLTELLAEKAVVLFFYPKDDSPGCTVESCTFRDRYDEFVEAGAAVVGVSSDSEASHDRFAKKHGLPMTLLSDPGGRVAEQFGVKATLGLLPGRATFVIDRRGIIRHVFSSQLRVNTHVAQALDVVRTIAAP